ncbi:Ig-like domain-containing protein [Paenibacillus oryzisoli]|uniref:Ig-like domain-containing protein n=1 Tax=Paenibacillus oryzisoli TaxID=1850517 RepID=UPI003D2AE793
MKRLSSLWICMMLILTMVPTGIYAMEGDQLQSVDEYQQSVQEPIPSLTGTGGTEGLQIVRPVVAGAATGSQFFPLERAFDGQPDLDENTGNPVGGTGASDAPAYNGGRVGYIDFGADWSKVRIVSTWTKYRASSSGDQSPYAELWWDNDINTVIDSVYTESRINFNSAKGLSTGAMTPWIMDSDVSGSPVTPKARYLLVRGAATMTNRASEYAMIGWIDANGNGVQDAPFRAVSGITVSGAGGATSLLTNAALQMSAVVQPFIATDKSYVWSVQNGTGSATIDATGLLTAVSEGTVMVKATALDGSGVTGMQEIVISKYNQLILPVQGSSNIYYKDLQASFKNVNWQTLERLYIPAGDYQYIKLGNLPKRSADHPLIITNYGGKVAASGTYAYTLSMEGGSHWILTGEYNEDLKTGDVHYQGHQDGNYADSAGHYGIEVGRNTSNGIGVGNGATNFELSYIEVAHAGFAGLLIKTDGVPTATMDGVKIHDMYVHDSESEGMYIGNTSSDLSKQHIFTNLEIYNNRVLRSGTEGIQLSNMGDGIKVHNNVVVMSSMDWKDPFQQWQDGVFQYSQRIGSAEIYDNVFIGGASNLFTLRLSAAPGETPNPSDEVVFRNNYFSHGRDILGYVHNTPSNYASKFRFENNMIQQFNYQYDELPGDQVNSNKFLYVQDNTNNPMIIDNNTRDGGQVFIDAIGGNNGTTSHISASGNNTLTPAAPILFRDVTFPADFDWSKVERWDDYSDLYKEPIYFNYGDYVYYFPTGELYECIEPGTHTGKNPTTNPSTWKLLVPMKEDFRLDPASPYQGIGLLDGRTETLDTMPPAIGSPEQLSFLQNEPVLVNITANDNGGSGLHSLETTFNGETVGTTIAVNPFELGVGTYPIVVTAVDRAGNQTVAEFTLVIRMDANHLDELVEYGADNGWISNNGIRNSLMSHVNNIQRDQGDAKKFENSIKSMQNTVSAQKGKHIDEVFANVILADLAVLQNTIGN